MMTKFGKEFRVLKTHGEQIVHTSLMIPGRNYGTISKFIFSWQLYIVLVLNYNQRICELMNLVFLLVCQQLYFLRALIKSYQMVQI